LSPRSIPRRTFQTDSMRMTLPYSLLRHNYYPSLIIYLEEYQSSSERQSGTTIDTPRRDFNQMSALPSHHHRRQQPNGGGIDELRTDASKARLFLFIACFWPLWILALFASSSANQDLDVHPDHKLRSASLHMRNVLDRVDIMGYGATHPRVAVVVTGEDKANIQSSVESIYSNTDLNRLFVVCVVVDGHAEDSEFQKKLEKIDAGSVPHWHGIRADIHLPGQKAEDDEDPHGRKMHVLFNEQKRGVAASRLDAVDFIDLLQKKYENAGLKSVQEDLLLLLMESGAQLTDKNWLGSVTSALIVPPPLIGAEDMNVAMKLANAVSFNLEGPSKRTSFDEKFAPMVVDAMATDINLSSGMSYPTPALNGAAVAMRLATFQNLPSQDETLMDAWAANLELSLNLWLCADGIDILQDVNVQKFDADPMVPLDPETAGRFAAAWMEDRFAHKFFQAYSSTISRLEWETFTAKARGTGAFPKDLTKKCRSFEWYAKEINPDFSKVLEQVVPEQNNGKLSKEEIQRVQEKAEQKEQEKAQQAAAQVEEIQHEEHHHPPPGGESGDDTDKSNDSDGRRKPSKPLCEECLDIVKRAKPMDISYVDISGGNREFPHKGAKDEDGNWGYVHDETALRKEHPAFSWEDDEKNRMCTNRDNNWKMLTQRVYVDFEYEEKRKASQDARDKIFCLVYTTSNSHNKIPFIRETWG
jgi:hypothetical protein